MRGQPPFTVAEQLLHLVVTHPVVLVVVQYGDEDVEVREQVAQAHLALQAHREAGAVAPFGELFVQGKRPSADRVAQRLKQILEEPFTPAARQHGQFGFQGQGLLG